MKIWNAGLANTFFWILLSVGFCVIMYPVRKRFTEIPADFNTTKIIGLNNRVNTSRVVSDGSVMGEFNLSRWNLTSEEQGAFYAWKQFGHFTSLDLLLPNATESIEDGVLALTMLMNSVDEEKRRMNGSLETRSQRERLCPRFLSETNVLKADNKFFKLQVPCGLTHGSSVTFVGVSNGSFLLDLIGEPLPGEQDPPIILRYNISFYSNGAHEDPVIIQNTWTNVRGWGDEERCPSFDKENGTKVDGLNQCEEFVGRSTTDTMKGNQHSYESVENSSANGSKQIKFFPFKKKDLFVITIRVSLAGFHLTVDGNHITSFTIRETLEPWLVNHVRISGDVNVISVFASGLPVLQYLEHLTDLNALQPPPLPSRKELSLFIGVLSTACNFKRRMAVRRSWMQYPAIRHGQVAVRFFVGLNKNHTINSKLWDEALTFNDIQMLPFVDSYSLITWKTMAICIYGTEVASAKYIMKTDDDSFVRVDEILNSLDRINATHGLLYGLIYSDLKPHREPESKWYTTREEWPDEKYPPWASGPGYVVSKDIAEAVSKKHREGHLKMFKLEDVSMGMWIMDMKNNGLQVRYENDVRLFYGCKDGYVVAHQQGPGDMLCLWRKIQQYNLVKCCGN